MVCTCTEFAERYNFAAGPAMLPAEVLTQIREEMPDWRGSGSSILEQPFTSAAFKGLMEEVEADLRTLLSIPRSYRVLFLQGGASAQFGLLPLNLLHPRQSADYLESGHWARRAISEARRHARVNVIASAAAQSFTALPSFEQWRSSPDAGYCHITSNETGNGLQLRDFPQLAVPLVADMTSDFLTRPIPVDRFGLIYASAQKNLGIAGLCVVIVHQNLLRRPPRHLPAAFSYAVQAEQQRSHCGDGASHPYEGADLRQIKCLIELTTYFISSLVDFVYGGRVAVQQPLAQPARTDVEANLLADVAVHVTQDQFGRTAPRIDDQDWSAWFVRAHERTGERQLCFLFAADQIGLKTQALLDLIEEFRAISRIPGS